MVNEKIKKSLAYLLEGALCLSIGSLSGGVMYKILGPSIDKSKIFPRKDKPSIIRHYRGGTDQIMIENPEIKGEYIPLNQYLETIQNKVDRKIEKLKIKEAVGWYK